MKTTRAVSAVLTLAAVSACGGSEPSEPAALATSVVIGNRYPSLFAADTTLLRAAAWIGTDSLEDKAITWSSLTPAVATVSPTGVVTSVAAGNATIRAEADTAKTEVTVVVIARPTRTSTHAAYQRDSAGRNLLRIVDANGANLRTLSDINSSAHNYAWSPDGNRVLINYTQRAGLPQPAFEAVLRQFDGSSEVSIGTTIWPDQVFGRRGPHWGPTNKLVHLKPPNPGQLSYTVDVLNGDGTGNVSVVSTPANFLAPRLSPDGRVVAYEKVGDAGGELWLASLDGALHRKVNLPHIPTDPEWSPDGKSIVYSGPDGARILRIADGNLRLLGTCCAGAGTPRWSPDGTRIAFYRVEGSTVKIVIADAVTGAETPVSLDANNGQRTAPSWSADSQWLLVTRIDQLSPAQTTIMKLRFDGTQLAPLLTDGNPVNPRWRP